MPVLVGIVRRRRGAGGRGGGGRRGGGGAMTIDGRQRTRRMAIGKVASIACERIGDTAYGVFLFLLTAVFIVVTPDGRHDGMNNIWQLLQTLHPLIINGLHCGLHPTRATPHILHDCRRVLIQLCLVERVRLRRKAGGVV